MQNPKFQKDVAAEPGDNMSAVQLIDVLEGRSELISKRSALQSFSRRQFPDGKNVIRRIIENKHLGQDLRYEATDSLSKIKDADVQDILLEYLNEDDGYVLSGILKSLAVRGDEKVLSRILEIKEVHAEAETALQFARVMLAFKYGDDRVALPDSSELKYIELNDAESEKIEVNKNEIIEIEILSKSIQKENISERTSEQDALININCGKNSFVFLINNESKKNRISSAFRRKSIAGFLMQKHYCPNTYSLKYYLLSDLGKAENETNLYVINTRGKVLYAGKGNLQSDLIHFWLKSVQQSSMRVAAIDISGSLNTLSNKIIFNKSVSAKTLNENQEFRKQPSQIVIDKK